MFKLCLLEKCLVEIGVFSLNCEEYCSPALPLERGKIAKIRKINQWQIAISNISLRLNVVHVELCNNC